MTSPAHAAARPKAPTERTFVVAVTLLSLAAVAQLIAAVLALAPQINLDHVGRSLASLPSTAAAPAAVSATTVDDPAKAQQANALMSEADQFRARGNFQGALEAVTEADRLVPGKAGLLLQMGYDYASLKKVPEAVATFNRIIALPPSADPADAGYQAEARAALAHLGSTQTPAATGAPVAAEPSAGVRDDVGIPIGSVMGIVKVEMLNAEPGKKNLRVATKGSSSQQIDGQKFVATVDFYEQDDQGQIQHNDAPQTTEWLSYPIDWANGEPELFQTKYRMPPTDRGDLPPLQYYGYVVAIYYNGELQDQRAEPVSLLDKFAPPIRKAAASE